jgi:hypothetical protein
MLLFRYIRSPHEATIPGHQPHYFRFKKLETDAFPAARDAVSVEPDSKEGGVHGVDFLEVLFGHRCSVKTSCGSHWNSRAIANGTC